ncbi:MotA/TolQ/ExbB proton channel family protein [Ferrimonas balearica]|uniref:MotA/TolQ/ExbB proton channel family protein n=1 Tax=Ferrimonas balearica TaxID=44012 RepID=UPI001F3184D9|nr:MotA/TolQ/ExbB proton channel family protein [Ferrimonas balearica]MBY6093340.1 MotA/TolQ/ExbB proton channel family protein [Ferrimonas balearica]
MRRLTKTAVTAAMLLLSAHTLANTDMVERSAEARAAEASHNVQRESRHQASAAEVEAQLKQQMAALKALKAEVAALSDTFSDNERALSEKETELTLATGALGEVYGVVRQVGGELSAELERGPLALTAPERIEQAQAMARADRLPELTQLQALPAIMMADIRDGAAIQPVTLPLAQTDGKITDAQLWRVGPFNLLSEQGFAQVDTARGLATLYPRQPDFMLPGQGTALVIDPAMGELLDQYQQTPTLSQRLAQGGLVGQVILVLLAIGALIALVRAAVLLRSQFAINKQLKQREANDNNPLGRILKVYHAQKHHNLETLELKLLEAIVNEQQGLEKGLSMLKLMAAIAPMLGLLGTVTGMIETFQVITQYGNGDPKVMAGGISMALVTTVLGLVAAMPLLLAHNLLSTRVTVIRSLLEKESIALVAAHADGESKA